MRKPKSSQSAQLWSVLCKIPRYPGETPPSLWILAASMRTAEVKALRWMRKNYNGAPRVVKIEHRGEIDVF